MNTKWLLNLFFFLLFCLLGASAIFAQAPLPSVVSPDYNSPIADPAQIPKFANALPVVLDLGLRSDYTAGGTATITVAPVQWDMLGTGHMTSLFGFGIAGNACVLGSGAITHPGGTIIAKQGVPLTVHWINNLGHSIPLQIDSTIMMAYNMPGFRGHNFSDLGIPFVPHLHGHHSDAIYDGDPEQWWNQTLYTAVTHADSMLAHGPQWPGTTNWVYDNSQPNSTLWYHDHSLGTTRILAYMGAAGFYLVRDNNELALIAANQLPNGAQEVELAFQDKSFWPNGQLAWPDVPNQGDPLLNPPARSTMVPEMFGTVNCVNGKVWPYFNVQPRQYRFRLLNACDSRFYHFTLPGPNGIKVPFKIIGSEGGLLYRPVVQTDLLIAPGERYDVVIDFSNPALLGQNLVLMNDAATPYNGDGIPLDPLDPTTQVMQFRVSAVPVVDNVSIPTTLRAPITRLVKDAPTRKVLLWETVDEFGRTMPVLGTPQAGHIPFLDMMGMANITESPLLNSTEVWEVYNTTMDAHPIHLHLVQFQTLNRQAFTATQDPITGALSNISLVGPPLAPRGYELGWKDTKVMYPGEVTRVIATFDKPGTYVWHCHILSHEEHDMMRYFEVVTTLPKETAQASVPINYSLSQNYPNPFNPTTTIKFTLPENTFVTLKIYDVLGREVATLINNQAAPKGNHEVQFDASKLTSGMYVYRLQAGSFTDTKKMLLMK